MTGVQTCALPIYVAGVGAAAAGTMLLLVRVFDAFADVFAGRVVDSVNTRWGKFRPFLLFGTAPLMIFSVLVASAFLPFLPMLPLHLLIQNLLYDVSQVALDTNTLADNVDLDNAVANVVPTRGAIVRAEFKARVGIKLLMTLTHNNKPLPFGAMVTSESSQSSGIVADNGQVYLSGMPLAGKVQVKWGEEENLTIKIGRAHV